MNAFYPNGGKLVVLTNNKRVWNLTFLIPLDFPTIEDRRMKMLDVHEQRYFVELLDATEAMQELPHYVRTD